MDTAYLQNLFSYNRECNKKLREILKKNWGEVSASTVRLYSHILNAHHIWNRRIEGKEIQRGVWQVYNLNEMKNLCDQNHDQTEHLMQLLKLSDTISYKTLKGTPYSNALEDILFHIINHSTYHRGQVNLELRSEVNQAIPMDYIVYCR